MPAHAALERNLSPIHQDLHLVAECGHFGLKSTVGRIPKLIIREMLGRGQMNLDIIQHASDARHCSGDILGAVFLTVTAGESGQPRNSVVDLDGNVLDRGGPLLQIS